MTTVVAHPNIALVKYWGKRDRKLNLPAAGSLSLTLAPMHTRTTLSWGHEEDLMFLDGQRASQSVVARTSRWLDLIRTLKPGLYGAHIETSNDFPTAAGLASSSSGFAALALAATHAAGIELSASGLSVLARRGSGSAARSLFGGFAVMNAGTDVDGRDAHASSFVPEDHWDLRVVVAVTTTGAKDVSSTDGMNRTEQTSPYFSAWVGTVEPAIESARAAIESKDFGRLAQIAEASALQMHASAIAAVPGVIYWNGTTLDVIHAVRSWRAEGLEAFFTVDAGPHVKVFTTPSAVDEVARRVAELPGVRDTIVAHPGPGAHVVA